MLLLELLKQSLVKSELPGKFLGLPRGDHQDRGNKRGSQLAIAGDSCREEFYG